MTQIVLNDWGVLFLLILLTFMFGMYASLNYKIDMLIQVLGYRDIQEIRRIVKER